MAIRYMFKNKWHTSTLVIFINDGVTGGENEVHRPSPNAHHDVESPLHGMWKHWNDVNFRSRENGTSIKTPATKVVQNTKVKVVSYTRWTRRGPPRFPGDIRDLFLHLAETSLSLWIPWVSFVTRKNHFLQDQSCQTRPRKVSRLIEYTNIRPLNTTSARIIRH